MTNNFSKPLNYNERLEIEKHLRAGKSCSQIALLIGRSKNAVVTEVRRGGGKLYDAANAQINADKRMSSKYEKLSIRNKGNKVTFKMKKRIENLEMQIEILHECIKELMKK